MSAKCASELTLTQALQFVIGPHHYKRPIRGAAKDGCSGWGALPTRLNVLP